MKYKILILASNLFCFIQTDAMDGHPLTQAQKDALRQLYINAHRSSKYSVYKTQRQFEIPCISETKPDEADPEKGKQ